MTLITAFRCRNNGILLCADRVEEDGYAKRPMEKICRIEGLFSCEVFIAGSGTTAAVKDAWTDIRQSLFRAAAEGKNIYSDHQGLIELSLRNIHARHKEDLKLYPLGLLIVVARRASQGKAPPLLYRTDRALLIPEQLYAAYGSGKTIADYLADRLYTHGVPNDLLAALATFIFRESEKASPGVGLGNDMVFVNPGASPLQFIPPESIKQFEAGIPPLKDAVLSYLAEHVAISNWLRECADYADSAESKG